jgi:hypothetical protein
MVRVSTLKVTVPATVDVNELEHEIVTALADRLRDDHGYELAVAVSANASGTEHEYPLHPAGSVAVDQEPDALRVKLHGVKVDAHDLFTGGSSGMKGFASRSADWCVGMRPANRSRNPHLANLAGGFAFFGRKTWRPQSARMAPGSGWPTTR